MPGGILRLEGIEFSATLGVLPEEKLAPRLVRLDIECRGAWSAGSGPLIDYRETVDAVAELSGSRYDHIEDLVSAVLQTLSSMRPDLFWSVTATKPFPTLQLRTDRAVFTGDSG